MSAITKGATLSRCGTYRYELTRAGWNDNKLMVTPRGWLVWVMLNPSTADAELDDPTIRRCIGFTRAWGYDGLRVVNLYALRATNPRELRRHVDPVGPMNQEAVRQAIQDPGTEFVVAAWGIHGQGAPMVQHVIRYCQEAEQALVCLGRTKSRAPRHPLYVRADQPREVYGP